MGWGLKEVILFGEEFLVWVESLGNVGNDDDDNDDVDDDCCSTE